MSTKIGSRGKREALEARREPYWARVREGCYVGYRKIEEGAGTWVARYRDDAGKQKYRALGTFVDGKTNAYDQAVKAAEKFFSDCAAGVSTEVLTVWGACTQYVAKLRDDDGDTKANAEEARLLRLAKSTRLAGIELSKLKPEHVMTWRQDLKKRPARVDRTKDADEPVTRPRTDSTVNRDVVPLRAALNLALEIGQVATDLAWRSALKPIKGADRRRGLYLTAAERRQMIEHAATEIQPFLRGMTLLPLRPGALAALTVGAFERRLKVLHVGDDKAGGGRAIGLPKVICAFLDAQCRNALPAAPLFRQASGAAWTKDNWKGPIKDAVIAAKLPLATTAYTLRHSVITDLVTSGLDLLTIAQISGTSGAMIEKHYGHLRKEHAAAALATLAAGLPKAGGR
jgi:site-specific recombinase XerD